MPLTARHRPVPETSRQRLRRVLAGPGCVPSAPVFDPLSARIAELQGWAVAKLSGSAAKAVGLALPDGVALVDAADLAWLCAGVTRAADVSVIVDADDCGGTEIRVRRTVRELEAAGAAGIELEDVRTPARFADKGDKEDGNLLLATKEEHLAQLSAAVEARRDPDTVIIARTHALALRTLDEALDRIAAFADTGAEAIMFPGLPGGVAQLEAVRRVTTLPLCVLGLPAAAVADPGLLEALHVRVRHMGLRPYRRVVKCLFDEMAALKAGIEPPAGRDDATDELLGALDRRQELTAWERRHAPATSSTRRTS